MSIDITNKSLLKYRKNGNNLNSGEIFDMTKIKDIKRIHTSAFDESKKNSLRITYSNLKKPKDFSSSIEKILIGDDIDNI